MSETVIDLTFPLIIGTDLYPMEHLGGCRCEAGCAPGGQAVALAECRFTGGQLIRTVADHGFEVWRICAEHPRWGKLSFTTLDVSYVESYRHIAEQGPLPREALTDRGNSTYRARVVHVDVAPAEKMTPRDLEPALSHVEPGDALIVDSNQYTDRCLEKGDGVIDYEDYNLQSPFFSTEAMQAIIDARVGLIAGNVPSFSDPEGGTGVAMLKLYWQSPGNLILAPLLHLGEIQADTVTLEINPLDVPYPVCGLPCRPVARHT